MHNNFSSKNTTFPINFRERNLSHTKKMKHERAETSQKVSANSYDIRQQIKIMGLKQMEEEQWIFSDKKIKITNQQLQHNHQVKSKLMIYRKQSRNRKYLTGKHKQTISQTQQIKAISKRNPNHQQSDSFFTIANNPYLNSEQQIGHNQYKDKIEHHNSNYNSNTQRYVFSSFQKYRFKNNNISLDLNQKRDNYLVPTAFSIQLHKPDLIKQKNFTPKMSKRSKINTLYYAKNLKKQLPETKRTEDLKNNIKTHQFFIMKSNSQKKKCIIDGWETENPSFHDFQQIYPEKPAEDYILPQRQSKNVFTFRRRIKNINS